jgi:hypothetical protein
VVAAGTFVFGAEQLTSFSALEDAGARPSGPEGEPQFRQPVLAERNAFLKPAFDDRVDLRPMEEGAFDHLEGEGKPIHLEEDPFEEPSLRMAHRLLRNNGFAPAWMEEAKEIEMEARRLREDVTLSAADRQRRVDTLNGRIAAFNLKAPHYSLHKAPLKVNF